MDEGQKNGCNDSKNLTNEIIKENKKWTKWSHNQYQTNWPPKENRSRVKDVLKGIPGPALDFQILPWHICTFHVFLCFWKRMPGLDIVSLPPFSHLVLLSPTPPPTDFRWHYPILVLITFHLGYCNTCQGDHHSSGISQFQSKEIFLKQNYHVILLFKNSQQLFHVYSIN